MEPMNPDADFMEIRRRLEAARATVAHWENIMAENRIAYSNMGLTYGSVLNHEYYNEMNGYVPLADAEFGDLPPLLEAPDARDGISSLVEHDASKGKGREADNEAGKENGGGRGRRRGKRRTRDKGKGKARANPYPDPRERVHLRTSLGLGLQPFFPSYLSNIGGCTDDAMADLLTRLRNRSLLVPNDHSAGDPSGCGVPHHQDD